VTADPSEEIFLAAQGVGRDAGADLRRIALRHAREYRRTHDADAAFFVGRCYYELPTEFPGRSTKLKDWLTRAVVGRDEEVFAENLLACAAFDRGDYLGASRLLARMGSGAFRRMSPDWTWRDIKVLELRCATAVHLEDANALAEAAAPYAELLRAAAEADVPAPHELVRALLTHPDSSRLRGLLTEVLDRHREIGWGDPLGGEIEELAKRAP
jgi:hypothetical protein